MCKEKNDSCCNAEKKSESKNSCDKNVPHKDKGTKDEYPCGKKRDLDNTCCCEED